MSESSNIVTSTAPEPEELAPYFPGYEIQGLLASGGMGHVYWALQSALERTVAIKVIPREFNQNASFRKRFSAEAKAMARLNHPNLIGVHESGEVEGILYIVMEFVPGKSLHRSAHGLAIDPLEVIRIVSGVCNGLAHAHENGILHRDIKPANILLNSNAEPKIGDFGLARPIEVKDSEGESIFGTPDYTAPEVTNSPHTVDHRADIFSVGVILHELLTAKLPKDDSRSASSISGCDNRFDAIIQRATHPDATMRYANAKEIGAELQMITIAQKPRLNAKAPRSSNRPTQPPHTTVVKTKVKSSNLTWILLILAIPAMMLGWHQYVESNPKGTNKQPTVENPRAITTEKRLRFHQSGNPENKDQQARSPENSTISTEVGDVVLQQKETPLTGAESLSAADSNSHLTRSNERLTVKSHALETGIMEATNISGLKAKLGKLTKIQGIVVSFGVVAAPSNDCYIYFSDPSTSSFHCVVSLPGDRGLIRNKSLEDLVGKSLQFQGVLEEDPKGLLCRLQSLKDFEILEDGKGVGLNKPSPDIATGKDESFHNIPSDAKYFNGRSYRVYEERCSWSVARDKCKKLGGQLVVVSDEQRQSFLRDLARGRMLWIGASRDHTGGDWVWSDGTKMNFKSFSPGAPNNYPGEFYLAMNFRRTDGTWDDFTNSRGDIVGYVCEWRGKPVTPLSLEAQSTEQIQQTTVTGEVLLEGEKLKIGSTVSGRTETQNMRGFSNNWSDGAQLWWRNAKIGSKLNLKIPIATKGNYQLRGVLTKSWDYGIVSISLGGKKIVESFDCYNANKVIRSDELDWGNHDLEVGDYDLTIDLVGANPSAREKYTVYGFGLDFVKLNPLAGGLTKITDQPISPPTVFTKEQLNGSRIWTQSATGTIIYGKLIWKSADLSTIKVIKVNGGTVVDLQCSDLVDLDRVFVKQWASAKATPAKTEQDSIPSEPGGIVLNERNRLLAQAQGGKSAQIKELGEVFGEFVKAEDDQKAHPEVVIYSGMPRWIPDAGPGCNGPVTYLMPRAKAELVLPKRRGPVSRFNGVLPGFPPGLIYYNYDVKCPPYNRMTLVVDLADQVVSVQFEAQNKQIPLHPDFPEPHPKPYLKWGTLLTRDFIEVQWGRQNPYQLKYYISEGNGFVLNIVSGTGTRLWFVPRPLVRQILFNVEGYRASKR